ncbi:hypothetical protein [Streptomyces kaempferi]|uniref:Uncharacterized protein n=1 Tax=Streptomyces kaempferi TaxID=333725 RepID=A0ABW3X745_9ACTN
MTVEPTDFTTDLPTAFMNDSTAAFTAAFTAGVIDAVSAVEQGLVQEVAETDDPSLAGEFGFPAPLRHARFDLVREQA